MCCEAPSRKIHVEFGEVETGATAVKWIEIINESCVSMFLIPYSRDKMSEVFRCMRNHKIFVTS